MTSYCMRGVAAGLAALASLAIAATATAQKEPTFHVDVPLVNVFVSVTDKAGAPIGGLTRDDFQLFEDGKLEKIAVFERDTSAPLAIVLSVDLSGSVYKDFVAEQRTAPARS
jgi:Ca-activated chloride channel family protein